MSITRKEFERQYSAELLPSSFNDSAIGDLWDWKGFIINRHLVPLMNNLALVCSEDALYEIEKNVPRNAASIANIDVTNDFKTDASLSIPTTDLSLKDTLDARKVVNMQFSNVQGSNGTVIRSQMTESVNQLKDRDFNLYKERIRHVEVIMGLFFAGSIELEVDRSIENNAEIEAKLRTIPGVTLKVDLSNQNTYKYSLNNDQCPFAAVLIPGRDI